MDIEDSHLESGDVCIPLFPIVKISGTVSVHLGDYQIIPKPLIHLVQDFYFVRLGDIGAEI